MQKLALILLLTLILTFFTAEFIGRLLFDFILDKFPPIFGVSFGYQEMWYYIFGLFAAPIILFSLSLYIIVDKTEIRLKEVLTQFLKSSTVLLVTALLSYFMGGYFGWIAERFSPDLASGWIPTKSARILVGTLHAPSFFLSFFYFFLVRMKENIFRNIMIAFLILSVLPNLIFAPIYIAVGYVLAKSILYLKSQIVKK
ncbi:MAG: hypothetical protein UX23_C0001G0035 [Parcubacteria group bacterium GW2011_GWB1_45_9]|nr:MAG: hypothetical protein UX23_C0001G0035 [Parcubacteria group bacterium GW2011_GWB1_45_9]